MLKSIVLPYVALIIIFSSYKIANSFEKKFDFHVDSSSESYDDEELEMFPTSKYGCNLNEFQKDEFCKSTCEKNKDKVCLDYVKNNDISIQIDSKKGAILYTVEGVLSYYKSFVHKLIELLKIETSDEDDMDIKFYVSIRPYQLKKLQTFVDPYTKIQNSSIQDVTDTLKEMIVNVETYTPDSKLTIFFDKFEQYLGLSLKSLFVVVSVTISFVILLMIAIRFRIFQNLTKSKLILMIFFIAYVASAINNYFYLRQKKELLRKAHLASYVPPECFETTNDNKDVGFFTRLKRYFKYSPTSKICLDYSEAIMIDSFIQVHLTEVLIYTFIQTIRPIFITSGEFVNEFYTGLSKDLNFFQSAIISTFVSALILIIITILSVLLFFNEINLFHLFKISKKPVEKQENENEIRKRILNQLIKALNMPQLTEHEIDNQTSVAFIADNIRLCLKDKEDELKKEKDEKINEILETIANKTVLKLKNSESTQNIPSINKIKAIEPIEKPNASNKCEFEDLDYVLDDDYCNEF